MSNALAIRPFSEVTEIAGAMVKSGYFQDSRDAAQAIVKIMAGQELGIGPFASMTGIFIIQGRPALGANVLATLIKNDPRYDYRVTELTDTVCRLTFYENGKPVGESVFTADDAKRAGTKNLDKFPRNMLFARAISNGARWFSPGIFGGAPVYTPEELGAEVDQEGNVITGSWREPEPVKQPEPAPAPVPAPSADLLPYELAADVKSSDGTRYGDLPTDKWPHMLRSINKRINENHLEDKERDELMFKVSALRTLIAGK